MTITLKDVGSGFKRTAINENFDTIEIELNTNVLKKDGSQQLEADLDFNSNRGINLEDGVFNSDAVTLAQLNGAIGAAGSGLIASQIETQLGSAAVSRVFTFSGITYTVGANNLEVYRNGQRLEKTEDYSETSTSSITLTFDPNSTDRFVFKTNTATTNSATTTAAITHSRGGIVHNLSTYLNNRVINVKDYGAVGDGVTDDTDAFEAAILAAEDQELSIPKGNYKITRTLIFRNGTIRGENREYTRLEYSGDIVGCWLKASVRLELYNFAMIGPGKASSTKSGFINPPSSIDIATDAPNDPETGQPYVGGARVYAENFECSNWGRDGFRINNGNLSCFNSCFADNNGRNGMSLAGLNANAITLINLHVTTNTENGFTHVGKLDDGTVTSRSYQTTAIGGYAENNSLAGWEIDGNGHSFNGIGGESNTSGEYVLLSNLTRSMIDVLSGGGFVLVDNSTGNSNTIISSTLKSNLRFESDGLRMTDGTTETYNVRRVPGWTYQEAIDGFRFTTGSAAFGDSGNLLEFKSNFFRPNPDDTIELGTSSFRWSNGYITELNPGDGTVKWTTGSGTPEGAVTAPVGSMFTRTDGGASTTLYVKESGVGNTGWVAK